MSMIDRRKLLLAMASAASMLPQLSLARLETPATGGTIRLGATWRGPREDSNYCAGVLELNVTDNALRTLWSQPLPGRAHGLQIGADGSLLVLAVRPGYWLQRFAANGRIEQQQHLSTTGNRQLTGHAVASRDGSRIFTGETDRRDDSGWISVRDAQTLQPIGEWRTQGIEPHDLKLDPQGMLMVANGGIRRAPGDRKRDLDRMDSSVVRLDTSSGEVLGQWRLNDPRLSLRHMAWSQNAEGQPLLGIGLQAEHDDVAQRRDAPVLAVWNGTTLSIPTHAADAAGYAGDICAAPQGGFIVSSNRVNSAMWWHPSVPGKLRLIAKLTEAYALATHYAGLQPKGVLISAARGAALWHPERTAMLLPWPDAVVMENHWAVLPAA